MRWVDIPTGQIHSIAQGTSETTMVLDDEVSKVLPWEHGFLAFTREKILGFSETGAELLSFTVNSRSSNLRCSDAAVLPDGSVVFGTIHRDLVAKSGALITLGPDWEVWVTESGVGISNGLGVMPTQDSVVWVDSTKQSLFQFEISKVKGPRLVEKKLFGSIDTAFGVPDGLAVDAEGGCWVALWGGGKVVRFDSAGKVDITIELPTPNPTSCAFDRENNLWITTATETLTGDDLDARGAGGIWLVPAQAHGAKGLTPKIARLKIDQDSQFDASARLKNLLAN